MPPPSDRVLQDPADCPRQSSHTRANMPNSYVARQAWFERMARQYRQTRCDGCGYWVIWKRKKVVGVALGVIDE